MSGPLRREIERLQLENRALREMLEAAEVQIHGEWGVGPREPYSWEPELAQNVCELKTGHPNTYIKEARHHGSGDLLGHHVHCRDCGAWIRWATAEDMAIV